ncbi:hypothetical protein [Sulfurimonas sp.]|uniref:hypothetical protein n=1 Tax=Sulfurimonas sp. TaxID=2022749 RepID=UPI0035628059
MKSINKLFFLLPISFECTFAYDLQNGNDMYNYSKCYECHESSHFTHEDRKAKNFQQLHNRVEDCRYKTNAEWFDEDRDDVVHYLNYEYYKFDIKK